MHGGAREGGLAGPGSRGTRRAGARSEKQVRSRGRHAQQAGREAHIKPGLRAALNTAKPCKHGEAVLGPAAAGRLWDGAARNGRHAGVGIRARVDRPMRESQRQRLRNEQETRFYS
jgi:hypothetical protein